MKPHWNESAMTCDDHKCSKVHQDLSFGDLKMWAVLEEEASRSVCALYTALHTVIAALHAL